MQARSYDDIPFRPLDFYVTLRLFGWNGLSTKLVGKDDTYHISYIGYDGDSSSKFSVRSEKKNESWNKYMVGNFLLAEQTGSMLHRLCYDLTDGWPSNIQSVPNNHSIYDRKSVMYDFVNSHPVRGKFGLTPLAIQIFHGNSYHNAGELYGIGFDYEFRKNWAMHWQKTSIYTGSWIESDVFKKEDTYFWFPLPYGTV